ncbi:uncharacterized protein LOC135488037 [Lineus longissimus]|uniref:uncharacterized protein LOC135488037 n=1 Tax=Lineus longissimus TaxID=88925 RepID=UPI00315C7597
MQNSNPSNVIRTIEALARLGADFKAKYDRFSVLLDAVKRGDVVMVSELVHLGADMNYGGERGITVLNTLLFSVAVEQNDFYKDVLEALVSAGADVDSGYDFELPLFLAVERSDTRMVETLSSLGANMNKAMQCAKGHGRPISLACSLDNTEVVEWLLKLGADPNAEILAGAEPLLEALLRSDRVMLQCLLKCGANPMVGKEYRRVRVGDRALLEGEVKELECLLRGGARLRTEVVYGDIELNQETKRIADIFGIILPRQPLESFSQINECIMQDVSSDILTMLLTLGANKLCGWNIARITHPTDDDRVLFERVDGHQEPVTNVHSNLHTACLFGNLDIVRLLLIDGSDVHARDTLGKKPFDMLPLASTVDYSTLYVTRDTAMVMEKVEMDAVPHLACPRMESLVCTPGIGDVQSIEYPKAAEISEHVKMMTQTIAQECRKLPNIRLIGCGSAAEGTKVGLPDEMDFLAEVDHCVENEQVYLKSAGHDYVYYTDPRSKLLMDGSKTFHSCIRTELFDVAKNKHCLFQGGALRVMPSSLRKLIDDSNRRATSPLFLAWVSRPKHMANQVNVSISVDFVPSLHVKNWPDGAIVETWLLGSEALRERGYYIVPKPPHVNSELAEKCEYTKEELQVLWKISFPHLETYHMQHLEKRVKDVYLVAKTLRNPDVCRILVTDEGSWPKNVDKYITSYMLKMIFFKNVDEFLHSNLSLEEMVCRVYDQVEEGLSSGFIPLYFMPKVSALAGHKLNIPKCAKVAKIMKRFVHALCLRDCQRDQHAADEEEEVVIIYQRKPTSVYRAIEIGMPKTDVVEFNHTVLESNSQIYARSNRAAVSEWVPRQPNTRQLPGWILEDSG